MKAGILSINLHTRKLNYGAVLHSWVFRRLIEARDDVERCDVIDYLPAALEGVDLRGQFMANASLAHPRDYLRRRMQTAAFRRRDEAFQRFFRAQMHVTPERYTISRLKAERLPYDVLFFESDVIWSPTYFRGAFDPVFFGALPTMDGIRKIAYSASMGQAELDGAQREQLRELLKSPDCISMRERYATRQVQSLTDKPVADVLDPTLLAESADFDAITGHAPAGGRYVLVYFPIMPSAEVLLHAAEYAAARGAKLVEVSNCYTGGPKRKIIADAGVEAFLALVRGAEAVFCNSLHGVCLSILFHKEFYTFVRRGGGEKYRDLCGKFGLEDRYIGSEGFRRASPIDWDDVDRRRREYRRQSLEWLDAAIRGRESIKENDHAKEPTGPLGYGDTPA